MVLNKDSAVDIPAQADDDRLENVPAHSPVLLEEAQCFNEREGGVKALEHLIMFFLQMSSEVIYEIEERSEMSSGAAVVITT